MTLSSSIPSSFLDLFYCEFDNKPLDNSNKISLFTLKVVNNSFAYNELVDELGNCLHHFALSRKEVDDLIDAGKLKTLIEKAKSKLRDHTKTNADGNNEGAELGELLLYCFLESHLKASKILTKLELKTARQMYVNGSDGVHLLKIDDANYQLVFGESKLNSNLSDGISNAFESIDKLIENDGQKREFEIGLIDSNLMKEEYNDEKYKLLKTIIFPSAKDDKSNIDHSFGMLLGFDVGISEEERNLDNPTFRSKLRKKIIARVDDEIELLKKKLTDGKYHGFTFYLYVVPFSDLKDTRNAIISKLV